MTGGLSFGNAGWLPPVLALWAAAVALSRAGAPAAGPDAAVDRRRWRCASAASPSWRWRCWSRPGRGPRARPGANFFAVLADDSRSLQLPGARRAARCGAALQRQLAGGSDWQRPLGEIYQLRRYRFDARLERVTDFGGLRFDGTASHLASALRTLADRFRGAPLAGVLLFTDGNATDLDQTPPDLTGLPPLYPVLPDASDRARRPGGVAGHRQRDPVRGRAGHHRGRRSRPAACDGAAVAVELRDQRDTLVETAAADRQRATPAAPPCASGCARRAAAASGQPAATGAARATHYRVIVRGPAGTAEATAANNARSVRRPAPARAGPHALRRRPAQLGVQVPAPGAGERSAAAAGGAGADGPARAEVRLPHPHGARPPTRCSAASAPAPTTPNASTSRCCCAWAPATPRSCAPASPRRAEELFEYQALILDDLEAGFFSAAQQALVERFVSERGGGLLMLGGLGSFRQRRLRPHAHRRSAAGLPRSPAGATPARRPRRASA